MRGLYLPHLLALLTVAATSHATTKETIQNYLATMERGQIVGNSSVWDTDFTRPGMIRLRTPTLTAIRTYVVSDKRRPHQSDSDKVILIDLLQHWGATDEAILDKLAQIIQTIHAPAARIHGIDSRYRKLALEIVGREKKWNATMRGALVTQLQTAFLAIRLLTAEAFFRRIKEQPSFLKTLEREGHWESLVAGLKTIEAKAREKRKTGQPAGRLENAADQVQRVSALLDEALQLRPDIESSFDKDLLDRVKIYRGTLSPVQSSAMEGVLRYSLQSPDTQVASTALSRLSDCSTLTSETLKAIIDLAASGNSEDTSEMSRLRQMAALVYIRQSLSQNESVDTMHFTPAMSACLTALAKAVAEEALPE